MLKYPGKIIFLIVGSKESRPSIAPFPVSLYSPSLSYAPNGAFSSISGAEQKGVPKTTLRQTHVPSSSYGPTEPGKLLDYLGTCQCLTKNRLSFVQAATFKIISAINFKLCPTLSFMQQNIFHCRIYNLQ